MRRLLVGVAVSLAAAAIGLAAFAARWVAAPLTLAEPTIELAIEPGMSPRRVAEAVVAAGAQVSPEWLFLWFRLSGDARKIRAGSYEIQAGTSPHALLSKLVRGDESLKTITFIEGWTFRQVRNALASADGLRADTRGLSDAAVMEQLGRPGVAAEGRFFPDTYAYARGSSDVDVLRRALKSMDRRLDAAWAQRSTDSPLRSADEALILASIVEKETGRPDDRSQIAGVFINRLRIGMRLQTDPTVIYGLGETFDGNLRRRDLTTDTPWNTYTRAGLPPTAIALPGKASLVAAVQPAATPALYFVARGDGSSHFSRTLDEHNQAVNRYQRGRQ